MSSAQAAGTRSRPEREGSARRRLPADKARERILEAAERRLAEVGPEGLRLTDLAAELRISHPAILHHFGSREGLVAEVVRRAYDSLNDELMAAIVAPDRKGPVLLDRIAEFYATRGHARTIAWLLLSGRTSRKAARPKASGTPPFSRLIDLIHEQRLAIQPGAPRADTAFRAQLTALALLGAAIFGDLILGESGVPPTAEHAKEFRRRLGELVWGARAE
jgi:AcrR family transcriptional regulator